jgi:hypothetical protein
MRCSTLSNSTILRVLRFKLETARTGSVACVSLLEPTIAPQRTRFLVSWELHWGESV